MKDIFSSDFSMAINNNFSFELRADGIHRLTNEGFGYYRDELVMPKELFVLAYKRWIKGV